MQQQHWLRTSHLKVLFLSSIYSSSPASSCSLSRRKAFLLFCALTSGLTPQACAFLVKSDRSQWRKTERKTRKEEADGKGEISQWKTPIKHNVYSKGEDDCSRRYSARNWTPHAELKAGLCIIIHQKHITTNLTLNSSSREINIFYNLYWTLKRVQFGNNSQSYQKVYTISGSI